MPPRRILPGDLCGRSFAKSGFVIAKKKHFFGSGHGLTAARVFAARSIFSAAYAGVEKFRL